MANGHIRVESVHDNTLARLMRLHKVSARQVAIGSGLTDRTIRMLVTGGRDFGPVTTERLAAYFSVPPEVFTAPVAAAPEGKKTAARG